MDNRPIGVFDSGVGGLTVVSEFFRELPGEEIIYFGDTARVPYGCKSKEIITKYSTQIVNFLLGKNVKAVVIACGTVSSNCFDYLTQRFDIPMLGVVTSGAYSCCDTTKNKKVGVIGTQRTIVSGAYEKIIKELNPEISVYSKACPLFVPLAEEGWVENEVAEKTAQIYLRDFADYGIDTLVLGCTHYPLLLSTIKKAVGNINIVNPAKSAAVKMKELLAQKEINSQNEATNNHTFYVSDNSGMFEKICNLVLGKTYEAKVIDIEQY
ncbi:MAG: glutamate racemase [Clostridiales bacterium]|nr:glutamate racemase [Clostridiales bacterium]